MMPTTLHASLRPAGTGAPDEVTTQVEELCRRLLRAEPSTWDLAAACCGNEAAIEAFLDCLRHHGVQALVYQRRALLQGAPAALLQRLREAVLAGSAWNLRDRELLLKLCRRLAEQGVDALFFKGVALAWSVYGNPVWRSRTDADLLIRESCVPKAEAVLAALGYEAIPETASIVYYQRDHLLTAPEGGQHRVDLHWRLNNSELLARLFTHEELFASAVALPALGPAARRVGNVHALLIAAFHRKVHASYTTERYHWLLDIDLLARHLDAAAWQEAVFLARQRGMAATLRDALAMAEAVLRTPLPEAVMTGLEMAGSGECDRYFARGGLHRLLLELGACRGRADRVRYLRRLLLPPPDYMHAKYRDARCHWLPWLHARRAVAGGLKLAGLRRGAP